MFVINAQIGMYFILTGSALYLLIYFGLRQRLSVIGQTRTSANEGRFKLVDDVISSMAEIKIYDATDIFTDAFYKISNKYAYSVVLSKIIAVSPKFLIEGLGAIAIVFYMLNSYGIGGGFEKIVSDIAIYIFILFRLMPQVQKVYSSFTSLKYSGGFVQNISRRINDAEETDSPNVTREKLSITDINSVELQKVSFKFKEKDKPILSGISFRLTKGFYYSIAGPSGSGKTCLLNIISGLNDDYEGNLKIDNVDFHEINYKSYWSHLSYVPQDSAIFNGSIAENVALSNLEEIDRIKVKESLELADFGTKELEKSGLNIETGVGTGGQKLSGGQKQRIAIARALYNKPKILILDEATSALDEQCESIVLQNIKNIKNIITISVAHRTSAIEIADEKIRLDDQSKNY